MKKSSMIPVYSRSGVIAWAQVDREDYDHAKDFRWYLSKTGYVVTSRGEYLHRKILGLQKGDGKKVDHKSRNKLDCRRTNLRLVTHKQNCENQDSRVGKSSKHRGVYFRKDRGKWVATICVDYKSYCLGHFDNEKEAASVASEARKKMFTHSVEV